MEDFIEILIYILVFGGSLVGGIVKNYNKRKEKELSRRTITNPTAMDENTSSYNTEQPEQKVPTSLEDFLNQQFEIEEEPEPIIEIETPVLKPDEPLDIVREEGLAAFSSTTSTLLSDNLKDKDFSITAMLEKHQEEEAMKSDSIKDGDLTKENIINEPIDWTKAIVYSEILKRPY